MGLPIIEGGRTRYAVPSILPTAGSGILLLEELNRAERYLQQPALQLLTARTLHEYRLPDGWVCFAAINPQDGDYQVTSLDPALRARFLQLRVRADRPSWLSWALSANVHPAVVGLAREHDRILHDVPPRTWVFVSQLLEAPLPGEARDPVVEVTLLPGLDLPRYRFAIASPRGMSRGGDLPFVIEFVPPRRVMAGSREALEAIVRAEGLGAGLPIERFVELSFLMVVVGRGGPVEPPVVRQEGDHVAITAVTGDGVDRAPVTRQITVEPDGSIRSSDG